MPFRRVGIPAPFRAIALTALLGSIALAALIAPAVPPARAEAGVRPPEAGAPASASPANAAGQADAARPPGSSGPPLALAPGPSQLTSNGTARLEVKVAPLGGPVASPGLSGPPVPEGSGIRADFLVKRLDSTFRRLAEGGPSDPVPESLSSGESVVVESPGTSLVELTARIPDGDAFQYCQAIFLMFGSRTPDSADGADSGDPAAAGPDGRAGGPDGRAGPEAAPQADPETAPDLSAAAASWPRFGLLTLGEIYWHQTGHELTLTLSEAPAGPLEVWEPGAGAPAALVEPEPEGGGRVFKYVPPPDPELDRLGETAGKTMAFAAPLAGGGRISLAVRMHRSRTARKDHQVGLIVFGATIAAGALWSAAGRRGSRPWP